MTSSAIYWRATHLIMEGGPTLLLRCGSPLNNLCSDAADLRLEVWRSPAPVHGDGAALAAYAAGRHIAEYGARSRELVLDAPSLSSCGMGLAGRAAGGGSHQLVQLFRQ